jgi:Leucine-rich repeat (LRR) protein
LPPKVFYRLYRLEELNLQQNQLTELDEDVFDGYADYYNLKQSLLKLNLDGNRLTKLPNDLFNGFRKLRNLQLQSNQLVRLPQRLFQTLGKVHWVFIDVYRIFQRVCDERLKALK